MSVLKTTLSIVSAIGFILFLILWLLCRSELTETQAKLKSTSDELFQSESSLKEAQQNLDKANAGFKETQTKLDQAVASVTSKDKDISDLKDQTRSLNNQLSDLQTQLSEAQAAAQAPPIAQKCPPCAIKVETPAPDSSQEAAPSAAPSDSSDAGAPSPTPDPQVSSAPEASAPGTVSPEVAAQVVADYGQDFLDQLGALAAKLTVVTQERDQFSSQLDEAKAALEACQPAQ